MKIIGITGGVGSGKSEVLRYLEEKYGAVVCEADLVAKNLQKKGTICYNKIVEHFGEDILDENGRIDRPHLARIVFKDECDCSSGCEGKYPPENPSGDKAGNRAFCTGGGTSPGRTL